MSTDKVFIHVDGAARGNPGPAAIGAAIRDENGKLFASISRRIGVTTNNQAEYQAIIAALEKAIGLGAKHVVIYSDSELVANQLNGHYRVKNKGLQPLFQKVKELAGAIEFFFIMYIPREQNVEADRLANMALDSA